MHCFLFLRLDGFYARTLIKSDGSLSDRPLVLHRNKRVQDVNQLASDHMVYRGMPLAEAKAILQNASIIPWEPEPYREAQSEWLDVCTEFSDVIEPDEQHTAWIDLSMHPDPVLLAERLAETIGRKLELRVVSGLGNSKWIARLSADRESKLANLADPQMFLAPMKTRLLSPVDPHHRQRLEFLGYSTIGEVAKVPLNVLRSQFGEAATHIRMCACGGYFEPVEALYPPNSISERITLEGVVDDLQTLDRLIQRLASNISRRLTKEDKQSKNLVLTIEHEDFRNTVLRRRFTKPIQNYASALSSLRLLLTPPPEEPIVGMRLRLENVIQSQRIQQELSGKTTRSDRELGATAAFQHIRTVFGDAAIQSGSEIVEPRRKLVLRAWKDATGWT